MSYNLNRYSNFYDPFFNLFFEDNKEGANYGSLAMKTDVREEGENYILEIEVPGFNKKDISVSLKEGYLTISATRAIDKKKDSLLRRERFYGTSSRSFYVGDIAQEEISASYEDGVLSLVLPKEAKKKEEEKHLIEIK